MDLKQDATTVSVCMLKCYSTMDANCIVSKLITT